MSTLTVSPSGTAAIRQLKGTPPENVSKEGQPGKPLMTDGQQLESQLVEKATVERAKQSLVRPVTPDDLLDIDAAATGRFLDVTA
jgi:hypothetical protein